MYHQYFYLFTLKTIDFGKVLTHIGTIDIAIDPAQGLDSLKGFYHC